MTRPRSSSNTQLSCTVCHQSFSRQEHLTRHFRIHTHERPYRCSHCEKSFSRLDVLTRHKASHQQQSNISATTVSSRACKQCAVDRVRCSRSLPCRRCSERELSCCYPAEGKLRTPANNGELMELQLVEPLNSNFLLEGPRTASGGTSLEVQTSLELVGDNVTALASSTSPSKPAAGATVWIDPFEDFANLCDGDLPSLGPLSINWVSPGYQYDINWDLLPNGYNVSSQVNILSEQPAQISTVDTQLEGDQRSQPTLHTTPLSSTAQVCSNTHTIVTSGATSGEYYVNGNGPRAPFGGRYRQRGSAASSQALRAHTNGESSSSNATQAPSSATLCHVEAYNNLIHASAHEIHSESLPIDIEQFPSYSQVQFYVQQYFEKFHPLFPFLRRASFKEVDSGEWLLLLAVTVIGSRYIQRSPGQSNVLSRLLDAAIGRRRYGYGSEQTNQHNSRLHVPGQHAYIGTCVNIRILQAGILNIMCLLQSGKQELLDRALYERHYLVGSCISLALLDHKADDELIIHGSDDDLLHRWLTRESGVRTGMMIWFLDSTIMYEFGVKPAMDLDDIKTTLPSCEDMWECPLLVRQEKRSFPTMTLMQALEMLYIEKRLPQELSEFSAGLLIHAIYRNTKKMLLKATPLNSWTPSATAEHRPNSQQAPTTLAWFPSTMIASKWRNSACDSLDILHWHANSKVAKSSGSEHHTILHLHLARIIILTPTQSIQNYTRQLAATSTNIVTPADRVLPSSARTELLQWVVRDCYKARLAVIHCAALYWHVRRYSCDSIQEPYAIYIATLVLWAFSVAMQLPEVIEAIANDGEGIPEPSFCHLDRPLDDELVQLFVRSGHRMCPNISKVGNILDPGAAPKVLREGYYLLTVGCQVPVNNESRSEDMTDNPCFTWGIEESYAKALGDLISATTEKEMHTL